MAQPSPYLDAVQGYLYKDYNLINDYNLNSGTFALPVAELPPIDETLLAAWSPVAIVQAHPPYRLRNVNFHVRKDSTPPVIPSPQTTGAFTFLSGNLAFDTPQVNSTSNAYNWSATGNYVFVETVRASYQDGFILGSFPFEDEVNNGLRQQFGNGPPNDFAGAVSSAGSDVFIGYNTSSNISPSDAYYTYISPCYYPGQFLNPGMLNGSGTSI